MAERKIISLKIDERKEALLLNQLSAIRSEIDKLNDSLERYYELSRSANSSLRDLADLKITLSVES